MSILVGVLFNLLWGAAEIGLLEGIARGLGYIHDRVRQGIIPGWQVWLFLLVVMVVLGIRRFKPVTWVMDKVRERWHFHLVLAMMWLSLTSFVHWRIPLGLDLKGGSELLYRVRYEKLPPEERTGVTQRTVEILERRLNPQGTRELRIQQQGAHRILIQLPGADVAETQRDKERIQKAGRLEFRLVETDPNQMDAARQGKRVPGVTPFLKAEGDRYHKTTFAKLKSLGAGQAGEPWLLVSNHADFTGRHLARAYPTYSDTGPVVGFEFSSGAKRRFARFTSQNVQKRMAIVLDDVLYSAPVIEERIYGAGIIRGRFTEEEVNSLVVTLRAGSLPADVELEMENNVGPTLGEDSIRKNIYGAIVASGLVFGFMGAYYLAAGSIADFALVLNLLFVIGLMSLLSATLTLPGIAGLILTVGMSVDANVLIFERIREEKAAGRALRLAIANGYDRAFSAIFDGNLTTLITAVILYVVGTGPVKGFAVTLSLGIVISMFTALSVTHCIFDSMRERGWLTEFKMNRLIGEPKLSYCAVRHILFTLSVIACATSVAVFAARGSSKYDIDFTGGTRLLLQLTKPMPIDEARKRVAEAGYPRAEVQSIWSSGETLATGSREFNIRIPAQSLDKGRVQDILRADLSDACGGADSVQEVRFPAPLAAELTLKKPISEGALRAGIVAKGYAEEIIQEISSPDVKSAKYAVNLVRSLSEADRKAARKKISDALDTLLRRKEVKYTIGRLRETSAAEGRDESGSHQLEIDLDTPIGAEMLEEQAKKLGGDNITVTSRGGGRETGVIERALLRGNEAGLRQIQERGDGKFSVVGFDFAKEGNIEMEFAEPMSEAQLREKLAAVADSLESVVPMGVEAKNYKVVFKEFDDSKLRKYIGDDLTKAFGDCVKLEKVAVRFEPGAPPSDLSEEEKERIEDYEFVTMKFERPQPLRLVYDRLTKAACRGCVVESSTPSSSDAAQDEGREVGEMMLRFPKGETASRENKIQEAFEVPDPFKLVVGIGGTVAGEMKNRAFLALFFAMGAIILYIWFRFGDLKYGIAAVLALAHDVMICMGTIAIGDMIGNTAVGKALLLGDIKIDLPVVAAFLTIIGYSLNDTIVIFDRIRENLERRPSKLVDAELVDRSVNQTMSRTILTSLTTLIVVVVLYFMGGSAIHAFALTLLAGIISGTYSTIFIASPFVIEWDRFKMKKRSQ